MNAVDHLQPLLDAKQAAHDKVLQVNSIASKRSFRKQQRIVKAAVEKAKEEWIFQLVKMQRGQGKTDNSDGSV